MIDDFALDISRKLSGIVFHPQRKTLFAVVDNGQILEMDTDGMLIRARQLRQEADFEGVTFAPSSGMLYVAIEGEERILEVSPETLQASADRPIDRMFEGDLLLSAAGNGLEGITYVPASDHVSPGTFFLVNQSDELEGNDPSIVFEVEIDRTTSARPARIVRYFSLGVTDLSGIHYVSSSQKLLVISDDNNLLLEVSMEGEITDTYALPGKKQEGITIDGDGNLYVAQDTKGALLKFSPLSDVGDADR